MTTLGTGTLGSGTLGDPTPTGLPVPDALDANAIVLNDPVDFDAMRYLVRVGAYLDGDGPSDASQLVRGVVYTADLALVAAGEAVTVPSDQPPGWVWLRFPGADGLPLPAGSYRYGIHAGLTDQAARVHTGGDGARTIFAGHLFTAGAPASLSGGVDVEPPASFLLETIDAVRVPSETVVTDDYLATLPFDVVQRIFRASGVLRGSRVTARAGWYGTRFDPSVGANAIVRSDGPLAELVGERILVSRRVAVGRRTVAVYVRDEREFPDELDEDILLTRRAFFALGNHALDGIDVTIEVLP